MVFFTVKGKNGEYPYIVLKGRNFYLKAQEVILGSNAYREYPTLDEDIKDLSIEVLNIDIEPDSINRVVSQYFSKHDVVTEFHPIYENTIKKEYEKFYVESSFDFYRNLCLDYSEERIAEIVYAVVYQNVSKNWIAGYLALERYEVDFILDYLPAYYNYIDFSKRGEVKHGIHNRSDL